MPANLSPEYIEAERRYRAAKSHEERLSCLEEMLSKIPKHKGTEKMQAGIRRKISQLKQQAEAQNRKRKGHSYKVNAEGAGQIVLVGAPNTGKSALLAAVTNAEPEVADYPFTTRAPMPGMMPYLDIRIQLVDLPAISSEHLEGWVADVIKAADGVLIFCDLASDDPVVQIDESVALLRDFGIELLPPTQEPVPELRGNQKKAIIAANKIDLPDTREMFDLVSEMQTSLLPILAVSCVSGQGLETLKHQVFELLKIMRVYSKQPGKPPDMNEPFTIHRGANLMEFAGVVHKDFVEQLKYGRVWGSGKFEGQIIKHDHILQDGDIVELHL
ncbi:MAG TPA: 50S ribosome-binding GTPase [bacterium]|nr:50S ribosome-binding GTPase [bacterium]